MLSLAASQATSERLSGMERQDMLSVSLYVAKAALNKSSNDEQCMMIGEKQKTKKNRHFPKTGRSEW